MITRKLLDISVAIDAMAADGSYLVSSRAFVTDDVEGMSTNVDKKWNAPSVRTAAQALLDAVMAQAAQQGKPMTL